MYEKSYLLILLTFTATFRYYNGCQIDDVNNWSFPLNLQIYDVTRDTILSKGTSGISGISSITFGVDPPLNGGPYMDVSFIDSVFEITPNDQYPNYEENETESLMVITVDFTCTSGNTERLVIIVDVIDTNNNAPNFLPTDVYEFTIIPPVPPGFLLTSCLDTITVRDIDLTTERIDFSIEENSYITIESSSDATVAKEFGALLKTTNLIRTLPEPIVLRISATDVDRTGDPPITTNATVRIIADNSFEFPEEPGFSQTFYMADYTYNHSIVMSTRIYLERGYDDQVSFELDPSTEYADYFELSTNDNNLIINVATPLPLNTLSINQIFLVIKANRIYTSGTSTTIVIQLPEAETLQFEQKHYMGQIENNTLQLPDLILSQGYESGVQLTISGEFSSYFSYSIRENVITLEMSPLDDNILAENNLISIHVTAITNQSATWAVITLEIIKDDNITPVFEKSIYEGNYDPETGLILEYLILEQGYDDTLEMSLSGEYASYFQLIQNGSVANIRIVNTIPSQILWEQHWLILSVHAIKPRTVGAHATVVINLPTVEELQFQQALYEGRIIDNSLQLSSLILNQGYIDGVNASLSGELSAYFNVRVQDNILSLSMLDSIESVLVDYNLVNIEVIASTERSQAVSIISLEVIKEDVHTPVFARTFYEGSYDIENGLTLESIQLIQGYDDTVTVDLSGDNVNYFKLNQIGPIINVEMTNPLPSSIFWEQNQLILSVRAVKPRTVGAFTTVIISLPLVEELEFEQMLYEGRIIDNSLQLPNLVLSQGYTDGVNISLSGELSAYFNVRVQDNILSLSMLDSIESVLADYSLVNLEVIASTERSQAIAIISLEVIKEDIHTPIFARAFYEGSYDLENGLTLESLQLVQGYDDTVTVTLSGENENYFQLNQNGPIINVETRSNLPSSILYENHQLILLVRATKPRTVGAVTTIVITLPPIEELQFEQVLYEGRVVDNSLQLTDLILSQGFEDNINITLSGALSSFFSHSIYENVVTLNMSESIGSAITEATLVNILITATNEKSTATAVVSLEVIRDDIITPVFERAIYEGFYDLNSGLSLEPLQLIQGFDDTVTVSINGEFESYFHINQSGPIVNIGVSDTLPSNIVRERNQLLLSVHAAKPRTVGAHTTLSISLPTEEGLEFEKALYEGKIIDNALELQNLILHSGYDEEYNISLFGEFSSHFSPSIEENVITLTMTTLDDASFPENNVINLQVLASTVRNTATTVVALIIIRNDTTTPTFERAIYQGSYDIDSGLAVEPIRIVQGFDDTVILSITGEYANFFEIIENDTQLYLSLNNPLPLDVISSQNIMLTVTASKPRAVDTNTAVVIFLPTINEELTLAFERLHYKGAIENELLTGLEPIRLANYTNNVEFTLQGDLANYFTLTPEGNAVTLRLADRIPENLLPENRVIVLSIQASAPETNSAFATIVLGVIKNTESPIVEQLAFERSYYTGLYIEANLTVTLDSFITLTEGYDESVEFSLEGDSSTWFDLAQTENNLSLRVTSPIPQAVLANNQQLIFVVKAQKPGSNDATATILISLTTENEADIVLGFERTHYVGTFENDTISDLGLITLIEGYTENVNFNLIGELAEYFSISSTGAVVTLDLARSIPEDVLPSSGVIVLELQASAPEANSAFATIVLSVITNTESSIVEQLAFERSYYTGLYIEANLTVPLDSFITLTEGYEESVEFSLEGDSSTWFDLVQTENTLSLRVTSPIPQAVLANNQQLIFVVKAQKPGSNDATATIVISLTTESEADIVLGFERTHYVGTFENDTISDLGLITLIEGYTENVNFNLIGELAEYFSISSTGAVVTLDLARSIPEDVLPSSGVIVLELQASAPEANSAFATIVLSIITNTESSTVEQLAFERSYYTGIYIEANLTVLLDSFITLTEGYEESVEFSLEGDSSTWFDLVQTENILSLRVTSPIPQAVLANNQQLIFVIRAQKPGSNDATATIVISLTTESEVDIVLGFEKTHYVGTFENDTISDLGLITLIEGYTENVTFNLIGELAEYFSISSTGAIVTLDLARSIPEDVLPSSGVIVLELQASAPEANSAFATIVLSVITNTESSIVEQLAFERSYYTGLYIEANLTVSLDSFITLTEGYEESVEFSLEGDSSTWFDLVQTENTLSLRVTSPIPQAVLANNQQLIFVIRAQKPGSNDATATIIISLTTESEADIVLGFEKTHYVGIFENDTISDLGLITLIEGYTENVNFNLIGELAEYFSISSTGAVVTLDLARSIPEDVLPSSGVIVLELQASAPEANSAFATIVLSVITNTESSIVEQLAFERSYYTGLYIEANVTVPLDSFITLTEGYEESVEFSLEGDSSTWFDLVQTENTLSLRVTSPIPQAVLANNQQLIFVVKAQKPGSNDATATIVISLTTESEADIVLGFERTHYVGTFENDTISDLGLITLIEGYTENVNFNLIGKLAEYFSISSTGAVVTLDLARSIPEDVLPSSGVIVLELQASAPEANSAFATIVLSVITNTESSIVEQLAFERSYYTGLYIEANLTVPLDSFITLTEGYEESVEFSLEGDSSTWFDLVQTENTLSLRVTSPIPQAVLANNQQLIFVVKAQKPGSNDATATIVISLTTESEADIVLGFERTHYVGTFENDTISDLGLITLIEGYTENVNFNLIGELAEYFSISSTGAVVTLDLARSIPEDVLPSSGVIVLELQASAPEANSAFATIVLSVITNTESSIVEQLAFERSYYTGLYIEANLTVPLDSFITLTEGYEESVEFSLEGDSSTWFDLVQTENTLSLRVTSPIPQAVLANNQQLVFVVKAQKPGSNDATATIVISLTTESEADIVLGFERTHYVGTFENDTISDLGLITLIEGYTENVNFNLIGELAEYFSISSTGAVVTLDLARSIPEDVLPSSGVIVLELQASAPEANSAFATIVLSVITNTESSIVEQLAFERSYYTGLYIEANLTVPLDSFITLTEGYEESVEFSLEGDSSTWFDLVQTENTLSLRVTSPIPQAVLANNQQLIFVVKAQKPGSNDATATIVISLTTESEVDIVLGFEKTHYVGTFENDTISDLGLITLIEGYTEYVNFNLIGELAEYFSISSTGAVVTLDLARSIPEDVLPSSGVIVLELQASAPEANSAFATIVLSVITNTESSIVEQLAFERSYYTGLYIEANLTVPLDSFITLTEGYEESVEFSLEGDSSTWFDLVQTENTLSLRVTSPIPQAVLANNQQLIFVVKAQKPGSNDATATIVISLTTESEADIVLGFERTHYVGTFENDTISDLGLITLIEGYTENVTFNLIGELAEYFSISSTGAVVTLDLARSIPEDVLPSSGVIVLELQASAPEANSAFATIVLSIITNTESFTVEPLAFERSYYTGIYIEANLTVPLDSFITLTEGYEESVEFSLEGDSSTWFDLVQTENTLSLRVTSPIPQAVLANNQQLIFVVKAQKPGSNDATATIVISLTTESEADIVLGFERTHYVGTFENDTISDLGLITLIEGYTENVNFNLIGELVEYFSISSTGAVVTLDLARSIPEDVLPSSGVIVLELQASAPEANSAFATIVLSIITNTESSTVEQLAFERSYYTGLYIEANLTVPLDSFITLTEGYEESVEFSLEGDSSTWFDLVQTENTLSLRVTSPIPQAVLVNNQQLIFVVKAQKPRSNDATATIVISLTTESEADIVLGFERTHYVGTFENDTISDLGLITLIEGYTENVTFNLIGELAEYFSISSTGAIVTLDLARSIPEDVLPSSGVIVLELQASAPEANSAFATIVLSVITNTESSIVEQLAFERSYYTGLYIEANLTVSLDSFITLTEGYEESVEFSLEGDSSTWFDLVQTENTLSLRVTSPIPQAVLANNQQLIFVIKAQKPGSNDATATIVISLTTENSTVHDNDTQFERILYNGWVLLDVVHHESIYLSQTTESNIEIIGDYSVLFVVYLSGLQVFVQRNELLPLPNNLTHIALELRAINARAVLLLNIEHSDTEVSIPPSVVFDSHSYMIQINIVQTGFIGQVFAAADNGEAIIYSLLIDDENLKQRISVNNQGEIHISAPLASGVYNFFTVATTIFTQATATATVHLTVGAASVCGIEDNIVVPPLIVLDRDEEEAHENLVIIAGSQFDGCHYAITNRWPFEQPWLYVDENGLHTNAIDREDLSIAHMALSQVQVELTLHCESDEPNRIKRSTNIQTRPEWLKHYDYGTYEWVLTDSIPYNARKTLVNLIVNDINDNEPIFIGKDKEPIGVGYPIPDLLEEVLPRALAQVRAIDADVGVNAALLYWTSEPDLTVSPITGFVHVREGASVQDEQIVVISATDQNGLGLTGSLKLMVRHLDTSHIAVVTVQDAFLDDEQTILSNLSSAVGYDVKILNSVLLPVNTELTQRNLRLNMDPETNGRTFLRLFIYGLTIEREPVHVQNLISDLNNNITSGVSIISSQTLEEHLENRDTTAANNLGLLVATVILSILLFILIIVIALWFFLKWRKKQNYRRFSENNSTEFQNETNNDINKTDTLSEPKMNINKLKKSERRLQEMLDAPVVAPIYSNSFVEAKPNVSTHNSNSPVIIQSIDKLKNLEEESDNDEFGEVKTTRPVVSFNENVEKIIHIEDNADSDSNSQVEIIKL